MGRRCEVLRRFGAVVQSVVALDFSDAQAQRAPAPSRAPAYSPVIFRSLISRAHFAVSAATTFAKSAGVPPAAS